MHQMELTFLHNEQSTKQNKTGHCLIFNGAGFVSKSVKNNETPT